LDAGDRFPSLELQLVSGERLRLPPDPEPARPFNVVLVNRGSWCPFCMAQLKAFQVALEAARKMVEEHRLTFPVAYGVSVDATAEALGVFYEPAPRHAAPHLQSSGFILGPGGKVVLAVYSTGPMGRLLWQDVLGLVQSIKSAG
jgi:peroxiredoxin